MEKTIKEQLGEEIEAKLKELSYLDVSNDKHSKATDDLTKIHKMRIEEIKAETEREKVLLDHELETKKLAIEEEAKKADRKSQVLDRCLNVAIQAGLAIGGWVAYDIWHRRGLRFEETGTITSPLTRNLVSSMLPKFKK